LGEKCFAKETVHFLHFHDKIIPVQIAWDCKIEFQNQMCQQSLTNEPLFQEFVAFFSRLMKNSDPENEVREVYRR
jgi:hypothetical protein